VASFFVRRPIVAIVISILTVLLGLVSIVQLPFGKFPEIAPPAILLSSTYVCAVALTA
jgi:HAE1 family hydrophobic/amphiphilic exporter-1